MRNIWPIRAPEFKASWLSVWLVALPFTLTASAESTSTETVLEFRVNAQSSSDTLIARRMSNGRLLLDADGFATLRLHVPDVPAQLIEGRRYFPLDSIRGVSVSLDEQRQLVSVTAPASAFEGTAFAVEQGAAPSITDAAPGAFLNYQLNGDRSDYATTAGLYSEQGFYGAAGVLMNTAIGSTAEGANGVVRLETTFVHDFRATLQTVYLGDAITNAGSWGRSLRFGGVKFGTNFAVRPDLITAPLVSAGGNAVVPSTVDVFINNQQVTSQQVPPGPFVIDHLPAMTGAGDVRLVVRDALGREQFITMPFYSGSSLLQGGLSDYSLEAGVVRKDFALDSFKYGEPVVAGTFRHGFNDAITIETHAEALLSNQQAAGFSVAARLGHVGILNATLANGRDAQDSGWLMGLGFERSAQRLSFAMRTQIATDGFRQPGDELSLLRTKQQTFFQTGWNAGRYGTLALAYGMQTYRELPSRRVLSLTHSIPVGDFGYLSFSASRTKSDNDATNIFLVFTMPLTGHRTASTSVRYDDDEFGSDRELVGTIQRSPPIGSGTGYRLSAASSGNYQAGWTGQYDRAAVEVEAARYLGNSAQRVTVTGGATYLDGEMRATRSVNDSFALVEVPGVPDVTVFVDNQAVARTDENGRALVRNLRAYDRNRVSVDPSQLPLDTRIDSQAITLAPAYRSGSMVRFPVEKERGATFRLMFPSGKPVPAGAVVMLRSREFPVALDGLVYVGDFDHGMKASAKWNGGSCEFRLEPPPANEPLPDLGTVLCRPRAP